MHCRKIHSRTATTTGTPRRKFCPPVGHRSANCMNYLCSLSVARASVVLIFVRPPRRSCVVEIHSRDDYTKFSPTFGALADRWFRRKINKGQGWREKKKSENLPSVRVATPDEPSESGESKSAALLQRTRFTAIDFRSTRTLLRLTHSLPVNAFDIYPATVYRAPVYGAQPEWVFDRRERGVTFTSLTEGRETDTRHCADGTEKKWAVSYVLF